MCTGCTELVHKIDSLHVFCYSTPYMAHILFLHDDPDFANTKGEYYQGLGYTMTVCTSAREGLSAIARSKDIDVVIVHKDIGEKNNEGVNVDMIAEALRKKEELARLGIVSGEFPHGRSHVLNLGADFYFPTTLPVENPWILEQLAAGLVSPSELKQRGERVATPGYQEKF